MKYWLLTTEYPPFHGGGISTYCHYTGKMLCEGGHQVTIFVRDDRVTDYTIDKQSPDLTLIRFNSDISNLSTVLGDTARLSYAFADVVRRRIDTEGKPDTIEAQDYLGIAYYLLQFKHTGYSFIAGVPILLTLHSPAFIYLEYNRVPTYRFPDFWTGEMEKQAIKMADHLISPTHFLADAIRRYVAFEGKDLSIIRNPFGGIPPEIFPAERNRIVYYGKLSPQKGSFEMLSYFRKLWDEGLQHPLYVIGGTDIVYHPELQTMGQLVHKEYGDYIRRGLLILLGKIEPASLENGLKNAHVIIFPSTVDNLPYAVIEAMSLGKIVLASVQGGQREMIDDGINGFLFDHGLPGDFGKKLAHILSLTGEALLTLGKAAREKVRSTYDPTVILQQKLLLTEKIISGKKERDRFPFLYQEQYISFSAVVENSVLSVVIPYFNMGKYIDDCVRSIKNSTYPDLEIIIVDDGSTDAESISALERLDRESNLKVYRKQNEGLAESRNFGARKASGEFLAFLDADDRVAPDYYEKALIVLRRYDNVFFTGCWVQYFGNSRLQWITYTPQPPYALVHNPLNSSSLVYKKQAFLKAGLNDRKVDYGLEDYESVIHLLAAGFNGVVLPEFLFYYRVRDGSMFRQLTREKLLYSYKYISEKHAAYYTKFAVSVINLLNANGPGFLYDNPTFGVSVQARSESDRWWFLKMKAFVKKNSLLKKIAMKLMKW